MAQFFPQAQEASSTSDSEIQVRVDSFDCPAEYLTAQAVSQAQSFFPHPLDEFQLKAMATIEAGENVIVCAPTGSGKTAVAEYAIHRALKAGQRAFYTTPLKALSNQKYHDFCELFGEDAVGLLTGDVSIARDAKIVVMTTEVYRNMLYGTTLGEVQKSLQGVCSVVLDECHYMNDVDRGTVWEEAVIYSPPTVRLVALSATIANAEELCSWISHTHSITRLIRTEYRPVPLHHLYFHRDLLSPLMDQQGRLNERLQKASPFVVKGQVQRKVKRDEPLPTPDRVVQELFRRDLLPAIYFVFSRRGCENAMMSCSEVKLTVEEAQQLERCIDMAMRDNPSLENHPHLPFLYQGLACHHAGLLPSWKSLVEKLYQEGLIKVVFATETLAAGINMPARTTVIGSLSKYSGDGHRLLTPSEFLQMSGRAGRRGMDTVGHVVTLFHPKESVLSSFKLAKAHADPLESNFRPSYGMVLNLLQRHPMEKCRDLVERSFGQYLLWRGNRRVDVSTAKLELDDLSRPICPDRVGDQVQYRKWLDRSHSLLRQSQGLGQAPPNAQVKREIERLRLQRQDVTAAVESSPCHRCNVQAACWDRRSKLQKLQVWLKNQSLQSRSSRTPYWEKFLALTTILQEWGYLEGQRPTRLGETAASLRATNTVLLTEIVLAEEIQDLEPSEFAALLTCVVNEESRALESFKGKVSGPLHEAIQVAQGISKELDRLQRRHGIDLDCNVVPGYAPIVLRWAEGENWWDLLDWCQLEAGDLVRALRRTLDITRQLSFAPHAPKWLTQTCHIVEKQILRHEFKECLEQLDLLAFTETVSEETTPQASQDSE